jgi:hypothetical protein
MASIGEVMTQPLQPFSLLLLLLGLALQLPGGGFQTCQLRLHTEQLVFPQRFDALLQGLQSSGGILKVGLIAFQGLAVADELVSELLLPFPLLLQVLF